jgi:hypothetical protein
MTGGPRIDRAAALPAGVIGIEKQTPGGNMKLTHPTEWFFNGGGTDAEGGGSDGFGGIAQAWSEHPGVGAGDGSFA